MVECNVTEMQLNTFFANGNEQEYNALLRFLVDDEHYCVETRTIDGMRSHLIWKFSPDTVNKEGSKTRYRSHPYLNKDEMESLKSQLKSIAK